MPVENSKTSLPVEFQLDAENDAQLRKAIHESRLKRRSDYVNSDTEMYQGEGFFMFLISLLFGQFLEREGGRGWREAAKGCV